MSASHAPAPAPDQGGAQVVPAQHVPGPSIVPSPQPEKPRRTALWGVLAALVVIGGGTALYMNRSRPKPGDSGTGITVPTIAIAMGDVHTTIRVSGTIAAEKFAALLA